MSHFTEILLFIAGCFGYGLRGWLGKVMVTAFFALLKKLLKIGEDDVKLYHEQRHATIESRKARVR